VETKKRRLEEITAEEMGVEQLQTAEAPAVG
jgi:hypothetical protein